MVEILRRGRNLAPDTEYGATCWRCDCEFRFTRGEARVVPRFSTGESLSVECPCCGITLVVEPSAARRDAGVV